MVVRSGETIRIHPIDWANAGFGSPYQDLATLVRDLDDQTRQATLRAYSEEWKSLGVEASSAEEQQRGLLLHTLTNSLLTIGLLSFYLISGMKVEKMSGKLELRRSLMNSTGRELAELGR